MGALSSILWKSVGLPLDKLVAVLSAAKAALPELEADINAILAKLSDPALKSEESIAALALVVGTEVKDILSGKIDPRRHASDAA